MTDVPMISITNDDVDEDFDETLPKLNIDECHTDVESLDDDPVRKASIDGLKIDVECNGAVTDVEDYSDSGEEGPAAPAPEYPEISLNELLDQGFTDESSAIRSTGATKKKLVKMQSITKAPSPTAFSLGIPADLHEGITDVEDCEGSGDEVEDEKVYSDDDKAIVLEDSNAVDISDAVDENKRNSCSSTFIPKVVEPSGSPSTSSESEDEKPKLRLKTNKHYTKRSHKPQIADAKSDTENIFFSDDEKRRFSQKKSVALPVLETPDIEVMAFEGSDIDDIIETPQFPEINISFVVGEKKPKKKIKVRKTPAVSSMLGLPETQDEGHTDVENLNSSDDDEEQAVKVKSMSCIPIAVIKSDALTDVEDFGETSEDDSDSDERPEMPLPSPTREFTVLVENKSGEPVKQTTPLPDNILLGFHDLDADKGLTDVEDFSDDDDDVDDGKDSADEFEIDCIPEFEGGVVESSDRSSERRRSSLAAIGATPEPLTDTEDIFVKRGEKGSEVRRRRMKPKQQQNRPKSNFLDTKFYVDVNSGGAHTDVEDLNVEDDDVLLKDKSIKQRRSTMEYEARRGSEDQIKFDKFGIEGADDRDSDSAKGDEDLLNYIQTEAITLVDSILEESVTVVNNNSSPFNPSSHAQESDLMQHDDEHQLSHQLSLDENDYDQLQQQFNLPLINVNNYSINLDQAHSDEISDNFAIKSDCDIIIKSPTIESMSGKSFELDVDDDYNTSSAFNDVNIESSLKNNNTAANITTTTTSSSVPIHAEAQCLVQEVLNEATKPVSKVSFLVSDSILKESIDDDEVADESQIADKARELVDYTLREAVDTFDIEDDPASDEQDSEENHAIVRNIPEQKLHRVERKFEHLSSEVREDESDNLDLDQLVNKEDISVLQNDFSKISWDESLSATTGDFGSSTPDNDLQDVLNIPEPRSHPTKTPSVDLPKPTPRLTKSSTNDTNNSSMSSEIDTNNSISSSSLTMRNDSEQNASGENSTSGESFQKKKQFWENFEHPILPQPVPKPRIAGYSFETDTSSIRSMPDSKQVSKDEDDRLEDESFPISDRYDSDTSEHKSDMGKKIVTDMDKIDSLEEQTADDEISTKFYIGESSTNVIMRSSAEKRDEFAFDNQGYDGETDAEEMMISESKTDFVHQKIEIFDDKIIDEDFENIKSHLMATSTGDDSKLDLTLEEKSEFEVSEKLSRQQSKEDEAVPVVTKRAPIVHSPIKNETSFEMEKPQELVGEEITIAKACAIEVVKSATEPELRKPMKLENITDISSSRGYLNKSQEELAFDKTLEEVEESLEAVQEELIEVVKDGKLIKQSPSEFEINILPNLKYPASIPEQEELPDTPKKEPHIKILEPEFSIPRHSETEESQLSSNDESFNKLDIIHRHGKTKHGSNRWSATDIESSSESHYQSFEKTDSRPLSSDVENLGPYQSSEYETARDQSTLPGSTLEYHSAASTLNSQTISSRDSMKSLDSESSGNLSSVEASEASETLVPSTLEECDINSDILSHDNDFDEKERQFTSLESEATVSTRSDETSPPIQPLMKRSHEMTFNPDIRPIIGSVELLDETKFDDKLARSVEDLKYGSWEEQKFGSSLEEGSMLSVSISSASNLETMVELNQEADLMGSLVGSYDSAKIFTVFPDEPTGMTPEGTPKTDSIISTVGSTITTTTISAQDIDTTQAQSLEDTIETIKKRGHKRTDSTSVFAGGFVKAGSKESSDSFEDDMILQEDSSDVISSEKDETHGESSDSDYDRYETEYARSFRSPMNSSGKSKARPEDDKKSFSPGHSLIETIVEDVHAESELSKEHVIGVKVTKTQEYEIPNIHVTDDITHEDLMDVDESDKTNVQYAKQVEYKMTEEEYQEILAKKYQSRMDDIAKSCDDNLYEDEQQLSPGGSDSFEMLNEPDLSDEFVIIEEVAKEAQEFDSEGKSLVIAPKGKYSRKHDEEMEQYIVKSAPAATDAGSTFAAVTTDVNFEFEDSPPQDEDAGEAHRGGNGYSLEGSKRWVEMNLSDPANLRYPYDIERGVLEDIKEEDTDFEVGSSRISSFKDSYSSTPDYDALVRKLHAREHDNISMNSLQEFEGLEQVISLENRRQTTRSSEESLSNGSYPKRNVAKSVHGDDISVSSLKEFEGLENACIEAHLIEIRAKEEAALLLSRSDDSSKSSGSSNGAKSSPKSSSSPSSGTKTTTTTTVTSTVVRGKPSSHLEHQMAQEFVKLQQRAQEIMEDNSISIMEASTDSLEDIKKKIYDKTSSQHVSSDSLDNNKTIGDVMTSSVDSIEASRTGVTGHSSDVDSIENSSPIKRRSDSIDSIEAHILATQVSRMERDSIDDTINYEISSGASRKIVQTTTKTSITSNTAGPSGQTSTVTSTVVQYDMPPKDISCDSLNAELLLTSTESLETSSTGTNATYRNASANSQMSGSMTSCDSNTMIDTLDTNFPDFYSPSSSSHQIHQTTTTTATTTSYLQQEFENILDDDLPSVAKRPKQ